MFVRHVVRILFRCSAVRHSLLNQVDYCTATIDDRKAVKIKLTSSCSASQQQSTIANKVGVAEKPQDKTFEFYKQSTIAVLKMPATALVGAATRYIAGRNAVQTVYWRSKEADSKMVKVAKTLQFGKTEAPPRRMYHN